MPVPIPTGRRENTSFRGNLDANSELKEGERGQMGNKYDQFQCEAQYHTGMCTKALLGPAVSDRPPVLPTM